MMPTGIDMSAIQEALKRRMQGGLGGGGTPAIDQQSAPMGPTPTGGPNTPQEQPPAPGGPPAGGGGLPVPAAQDAAKTASVATSANFDGDTRVSAVNLIKSLLKYL